MNLSTHIQFTNNRSIRYTYDKETRQVKIPEENHYYPFGLQHGNYNATKKDIKYKEELATKKEIKQMVPAAKKFKYYYQEQERQDELGLNWDSFKYRNYDYAIGRFMSIDPLAEKYPYNGVYNFSENAVISFRELEGLEKVLAITLGKDVKYRGNIISQTFDNSMHINLNTPNQAPQNFTSAFVQASQSDEQGIAFVSIWGHGVPGKIYASNHYDDIFITPNDLSQLQEAVNSGEIKFTDNAVIYLGNCNAGTESNGISIAEKLSQITGVKVIGANDSVGLGYPNPNPENSETMQYIVYNPSSGSFLMFNQGNIENIGTKVDVIQLANRILNPIQSVLNENNSSLSPVPIEIKPHLELEN